MAKGQRLYGIQPIHMFADVTSTGTSSGVSLRAAYTNIGMQVISAASSFACQLQVSIAGGSSEFRTAATIATSSGDTSGSMVFIADQPIYHIRANLITTTTAITNVWVSASQ